MDSTYKTYDYRIAKRSDAATGYIHKGGVYVLCECHYNADGTIIQQCVVDDMTAYDRNDARNFLMRVGAAISKPIIDMNGVNIEDSLINMDSVVLDYIIKKEG